MGFWKTVLAILVAQVIFFLVGKFTGVTMRSVEKLQWKVEPIHNDGPNIKSILPDGSKQNLEMPESVKKLVSKLTLMLAKKKAGV